MTHRPGAGRWRRSPASALAPAASRVRIRRLTSRPQASSTRRAWSRSRRGSRSTSRHPPGARGRVLSPALALLSSHGSAAAVARCGSLRAVIAVGPHAASPRRACRRAGDVAAGGVTRCRAGRCDADRVCRRPRAARRRRRPARRADGSMRRPGFDIGERVVARALRALGVRALDALVVTHGDPDHIGGAQRPCATLPTAKRLGRRARSAARACRVLSSRPRQRASRGGPCRPAIASRGRRRDQRPAPSAAGLGAAAGPERRFGGRWRSATETCRSLPGRHRPRRGARDAAAPRAGTLDGVEGAHHGSATSSRQEFLAALRPRAVIFSAGRDNRFGHPAPSRRSRAIGDSTRRGGVFRPTDDGGSGGGDSTGRVRMTRRGARGRVDVAAAKSRATARSRSGFLSQLDARPASTDRRRLLCDQGLSPSAVSGPLRPSSLATPLPSLPASRRGRSALRFEFAFQRF